MPAETVTLDGALRVHVVGIGGAGMSGLARLLAGLGHTVSGSDLLDSPTAASLRAAGIEVRVGHAAANVGDVDLVTYSPAVAADNVELTRAAERGIRVATRAEVLGALCALREVLAVAGTHGKTTTSSMLTLILATAGRAPSWLVGADVAGLGANARLDAGTELVIEADESYGTFARLAPALCAVTNVEADHLDHYGTLSSLHDAFGRLLARAATCVVNADDPVARALGEHVGRTASGATPRSTSSCATCGSSEPRRASRCATPTKCSTCAWGHPAPTTSRTRRWPRRSRSCAGSPATPSSRRWRGSPACRAASSSEVRSAV